MSDCDSMRPLLAGLVYDDLPDEEKKRVTSHLSACAPCRDALASMRGAASALDAWVLSPARKQERVSRRRPTVRRFKTAPSLAWAAAAAVFLLALTLHLALKPRAPERPLATARKETPAPPPTPIDTAEAEKNRREAEEEIARFEAERRKARERLQQIEREFEKIIDDKKKESEQPHQQELERVTQARKETEEALDRAQDAQRKAEVKRAQAESKGTIAVVAQLEWVQGEVYVTAPSGRVRAQTAKALLSGQGLETVGKDSVAVVTFPDSTRLELGSATAVRELSDGTGGKLIDITQGTIRAEVSRQPAGRPLVLRTPDAESQVLGTRLRLACNGSTRLDVHEGRVRLTRSKDKATLELTAGHTVSTNVPRMFPKLLREVEFQDGVSPTPTYAGTRDTFLSETNTTHSYGTNPTLQVDGDNPGGTNRQLRMLLRWDVTAIPPGSKVQTATLVLRTSSRSEPPYEVRAMRRAWSEPDATWQTSSGDLAPAPLGGAVPAGSDFVFSLNAEGIAAVQSWIDSPASNFGFMILAPNNSSGMKAHSRESSDAGKRPKLIVTFTPRDNR